MQLSQYENIFSVNPLQRIKQSTDLFKMKSSIYEYSQFCVDVCQPKKKQRRLKSVFSDADIVACKSGDKSCYVKGRLQPTRSLGDIRLKFKEFNNPKSVLEDKGCLKSISNFKGPYISVTIYEIQKGDRYLVLGSDRLWDELTKSEISKIVQKNQINKVEIIKQIFKTHFLMQQYPIKCLMKKQERFHSAKEESCMMIQLSFQLIFKVKCEKQQFYVIFLSINKYDIDFLNCYVGIAVVFNIESAGN
ncbi:unnamed protein product [Paramecium octaurelia]|uniref:PPM-type phosphatase domain-containing protein n=1 Tax=Paramecium octaurelia TaxID=43137 RepID=A0A8S1S329_PAROT|nr:unnamed protein product [Paramecium octaurelia]